MVIHIGINGFGRIGRIVFRNCLQNNDLQVAAINDPAVEIDYICYLIKFDSTHGRLKKNLTYKASEITIDDTKIKVFHEKLPSKIPWHAAGVKYVIEASGMFTNLQNASAHLASESVKRVIVTAPSVDIPMTILGVNEDKISTEQKVISCASSTLYCLAPLIKILEDNYGVAEGFITSIHAMTPSLKPLDGLCLRGKHWRDHRSIHQNIIPAATGACKALGKIIPQVKDKMTGLAFRVPIVNVSVLDVTIRLNKYTTLEDIIKNIDRESRSRMKNIINTSNDDAVSSDFLGATNSCIFDVNSSLQLTPNFFKLICWYENEYSYACRILDTILYSEKGLNSKLMSKLTNELFLSKKFDNVIFLEPKTVKDSGLLGTSQDREVKTKFLNKEIEFEKNLKYCGTTEEKLKNEIFEIWDDDFKVGTTGVSDNVKPLYRCNANNYNYSKIVSFPNIQTYTNEHKTEFTNSMVPKPEKNTNSVKGCFCSIVKKKMDKVDETQSGTFNEFDLTEKPTINNTFSKEIRMTHGLTKKQKKETLDNLSDTNQILLLEENTNIHKAIFLTNKNDPNAGTKKEYEQPNRSVVSESKDLINNVNCSIEIQNVKSFESYKSISNHTDMRTDTSCDSENYIKSTDRIKLKVNSKKDLQKKMVEDILNLGMSLVQTASENLRPINTNTSISNGDRRTLSDIYDKLDSVSGTDSENSFQINERKSQVLNIGDLSTSIENFRRLDKICRIIEISDDLSDKLFSVLENNSHDFKRKNWSFKDLCERLKLEEFCNNVFGHS